MYLFIFYLFIPINNFVYIPLSLTGQVQIALEGRKVESIALVFHGTESVLFLCGPGDKVNTISYVLKHVFYNNNVNIFD